MKHFAICVLATLTAFGALADSGKEHAFVKRFSDSQLQWGSCPAFMPKACQLAVLHGDPAQANADVLLKVPGGAELPHHWHTSAERMILLSGELVVQYDNQPSQTLTTGMYAYGPAKHGHKAKCLAGDPCVLFIAFESAVDAVPSAASK